jgi:hypothetical protein
MSIQQAIQERITERQAAERARERAARDEKRAKQSAELAELRKRIGDLIPNDLQSAFTPLYLDEYGHNAYINTADGVLPEGVPFWVRSGDHRGGTGLRLSAQHVAGAETFLLYGTSDEVRRVAILDVLASVDETIRRIAERAAQYAAELAAAQAEDAAARPVYEAAVQDALAQCWRWPDGVTLTLYRWRWCTAPASDTECAEYEHAWSLHDTLQDGWLHRASINVPIRITDASLPTIERYAFSSLKDAYNADLAWSTGLEVRGFTHVPKDGRQYLLRDPEQAIYLSSDYGDTTVPLKAVDWLRALVDAAAGR